MHSCNTPLSVRGNTVLFTLRREPYYHKLQYSKTPKFDAAAAIFGAAISAFAGYLALSTLGSAGADLTDLLTVVWYLYLLTRIIKLILFFTAASTLHGFVSPLPAYLSVMLICS